MWGFHSLTYRCYWFEEQSEKGHATDPKLGFKNDDVISS